MNFPKYFLGIFLLLSACGTTVKNPTQVAALPPLAPHSPTDQYRIQVGDELDIRFFFNPELNDQQTVRPDGRISLQLIDEVVAAGKTPEELKQDLTEAYKDQLRDPSMTIVVRAFGGERVYVGGEVRTPGMVQAIGGMTALQSIAQAGGFLETARTSQVIVIRRGADNHPIAVPIDLDKVINGSDFSQDITLKPYDIVYVPRSQIADVNLFIDQYIRRNIPISFGFGYTLN